MPKSGGSPCRRSRKPSPSLRQSHLDPTKAVHRVRKQLKWIRALFALVRPADADFFAAENRRYRDIARSLARPRTAAACVETIDRFCQDYPKQCERNNVERLRGLMAARVTGNEAMEGFDAAVSAAAASCEAGLAALKPIPDRRRPRRRRHSPRRPERT